MSVSIYSHDMYDINKWPFHSDVDCDCGSSYAYSMNYKRCQRCGEVLNYTVYLINNKIPIAFKNRRNLKEFSEYFDSLVIASKLLGYKMNCRLGSSYNILSIAFVSIDNAFTFRIPLDNRMRPSYLFDVKSLLEFSKKL